MSIIKKIGIIFLGLFLLLLLTIAALPLWMPFVVSPTLQHFGVVYDSYERVGYGRFALEGVDYTHDRVRVQAERVEGFTPTGWLWQRWLGREELDYVVVSDWRLEIEERDGEDPPPKESDEPVGVVSVFKIFEGIEDVLPHVADWVPQARLGKGEVVLADRTIDVRGAKWLEGQVAAEVFDRSLQQVVHFEGDLSGGLPYVLNGRTDPFPLNVEVIISRADEGLAITSEAMLAGNRLVADAAFPREGYWPDRARFRSDDFRLPPDYFELEGYEEVVGSLLFEWREGNFTADLHGEAEPVEQETQLPPLRITASARGDLDSFLVETLEIHSPWLVATLSDPVAMDYGGELLTGVSGFQLAADLAEQPFVELAGNVTGEARISPGQERLPFITFSLTGESLAGYEMELARVQLNGSLQWPDLVVADLVVEGEEDSRLAASANLNFDTMEITAGRVEGDVQPELVARWLPEDVWFSKLHLAGDFDGPVSDLRHRGRIEAEEILAPATRPMNGHLEWEGQGENLPGFAIELRAGAGRLTLDGSSELEENRFNLLLREILLERDDQPFFQSVTESNLLVEWNEGEPLIFSLDQLHWTGMEREIVASAEIAWPDRGVFSTRMSGLSTDLFSDFLEVEPGFISLTSAELEGSWEESPIEFLALAKVQMDIGEADEVFFEIDARGESEQLRVERLRATSRGEALVMAEGILPVVLWPGRKKILHVRERGEINFQARTDPRARFWAQMGDLTGVQLEDPSLSLEITGTPYEPVGHITGSAPMVHLLALENQERPVPAITDLRVKTTFNEDRFSLEQLTFRVEGQLVKMDGLLRMGTREWRALIEGDRLPDWENATGRIMIEDGQMAVFTRFAPAVLSPQGKVRADIEILPGGFLAGVVTIEDAATRPLMPFGSIREGTARLVLRNRTVEVEEISAVIGGERLTVTGSVDIPFDQAFAFDLNFKGRNLPLTRRPGVVVRGDLDLSAKSRGEEVPIISGRVDLRDSFYFAHIRLMPTGAVATPDRRPPFFSVEAEPFNNWRLNVDLRGPSFLNVRGPIFQGEISANFNLSGTLEEPRAIGAATLDSGRVRFPFASMTIEQGEVALRREDPFQPQLFIVASGMTFGYDLRMEITGTAETPIIEFFSNPPLSSEQALLMVTTGELPRDEIRFSTQQRASRFAIYFGQNLLYELTGDDSASDRLVIRSGEQVSEGGRETIAIEYRLTDRWSVLGEYDRFDEYNVGLKWNIYSR